MTNPTAAKAQASELTLPLSKEKSDWLKSTIRDIPDFPKPGIIFKDITTLLKDPQAFGFAIDVICQQVRKHDVDYIVGIEARGFILGSVVAYNLNKGFIPIRKPNKLPYKVERVEYDLEYGKDSVEVHIDAAAKGHKVALLDDLLATGGTAAAAYSLLTKLGAEVSTIGFITELAFLDGRKKLPTDSDVFSLITY
ncbi:MAG: adenine phosphoribosyltransferase [Candidatus Melainabacteria bacterium]|jgi:adenine phosphoribosyltransferase|nr:adenine phosphoribosyltransferase [Candidatus Melainabacteria bacterium]